jgi:DNA-binding SARP family transcriptional activator/tetratricopeptide (TPR) repeat protein
MSLGELIRPAGERWRQNGTGRARVVTIRLLGPLAVSVDGHPVTVSAGRLRTLLATLAMSAGEPVSVARLAAEMWEHDPPADVRRTVQTYVARLRGALGPELIASTSAGYVLRAEPDHVDALRFLQLLDAADAAETAEEQARLAEAIALWRGVPFEGVPAGPLQNSQGPRLTEAYLAAVECQVDLDLAAGLHGELVGPLRELVAQHPLREPLWARLIVALRRGGRQAEALESYESLRTLLAEELGTDPEPGLQQLHADMLAGRAPEAADDMRTRAARRAVPRQLPIGADAFTGRSTAMAALGEMFGDAGGLPRHEAVVCSISGMPGVGKTALAVHAAHQLADRFPGGQLYVDLHGATPGLQPLQPLEVLGRFLRALGTDPAAVPTSLEEASAAFRSRAAARPVLVVLDNAADAEQVTPLLPASQGCGVLVTSRRALPTLEGATHLRVSVLDPAEAQELLGRLAGRERVAAEPEAAAELARCCGYLPLALRIAGARLAARPAWPVQALASRLASQDNRLDELEAEAAGVRASLTVSLQQLQGSDDPQDRAAASAFGVLGLLDGPELSTPVVARLLDAAELQADEALERLADAQLLTAQAPGRYQLHDLLRLYARELALEQHDERQRAAGLTRALGFYVATAWQTLMVLRPGDRRLAFADDRWAQPRSEFADEQAALQWLDTERANLLAAVQQAAAAPGALCGIAVQLAEALFGFYSVRSLWDDQAQVNEIAIRAARDEGDRAAEAQALNDLGAACERKGHYDRALAILEESLAIRRELGDRCGQAAALNSIGIVHGRQGRLDQAFTTLQQSLAIKRELGDRRGQAASLHNLGLMDRLRGRSEDALARLCEALAIFRELDDRDGRAGVLTTIGEVHERQGRYEEAAACHQESLAFYREVGDRECQAHNLNGLGIVHRRQGRYERALACHQESLAIRMELDNPYSRAESLRDLGIALQAAGRPGEARRHWLESLALFDQLRTTEAEHVRALLASVPGVQLARRSCYAARPR